MVQDLIEPLAERLADRYRFLSRLGKGGWGTVYEVLNLQLDRREALKVVTADSLDTQRSQRFTHEARIVAALDHPRIVKVYAFGDEEGVHWYSMQLLDGPTLGNLLDAGWSFDEGMIARVALPLMDALDYSHGRGVIHRDIKPANILFNAEGRPFLTDFGIAKSREELFETQTGQLLGTPAYISPEQALGEAVDARADQYSFAITLYKALTGELPFNAEGQIQTLMQRVRQDAEPIWTYRPGLAEGFAQVIMRALSRYREDRWESMAAMRTAMLEACNGLSLVWNVPLSGVADFPLTREPLPERLQSLGGHPVEPGLTDLDPTADLAGIRRKASWRWPWIAAAALLVALGWYASRQAFRTETAGPPERPVANDGGAGKQASPEPPRPAETQAKPTAGIRPTAPPPAEPAPRRVVHYPEPLEAEAPMTGFPAACQGVKVNVSLVVGEDGKVKACRVLSKVSEECAGAAVAFARRLRYKPGLDAENRPVECTIATAIDFPEKP